MTESETMSFGVPQSCQGRLFQAETTGSIRGGSSGVAVARFPWEISNIGSWVAKLKTTLEKNRSFKHHLSSFLG